MAQGQTIDTTFFPERVQAGLSGIKADLTALGAVQAPELGLGAEKPGKAAAQEQAASVLGALGAALRGGGQEQSGQEQSWAARVQPTGRDGGRGR
jgi:hypothetical protein